MTNLPRVTARLIACGQEGLLRQLLDGYLPAEVELNFGDLRTAKMLMRDLYKFLSYCPDAKARVSLSLNPATITLRLKPRGRSEKRGRRKK